MTHSLCLTEHPAGSLHATQCEISFTKSWWEDFQESAILAQGVRLCDNKPLNCGAEMQIRKRRCSRDMASALHRHAVRNNIKHVWGPGLIWNVESEHGSQFSKLSFKYMCVIFGFIGVFPDRMFIQDDCFQIQIQIDNLRLGCHSMSFSIKCILADS